MNDDKNINRLSLVNDSSNTAPDIEFSKTQLEILYAAEIIMGQKGIENTSHRDIVNLAGQKNTSAILYHFGSIEGAAPPPRMLQYLFFIIILFNLLEKKLLSNYSIYKYW